MTGVKFDEIGADKAHELVDQNIPTWFAENKKFVGAQQDYTNELEDNEADHWQDGAGFLSPLPPRDHPTFDTMFDGLKNMFIAEDIIGDCLNRRCNGVLGKAPHWSMERLEEAAERQPEGTDVQDAELDEINELLAQWYKSKNIHGVLKRLLNSVGYGKRAYLRLYIPPARFANGERISIQAASIEEALDNIFVEHLERDQACMFRDRMSMRSVGIITFEGELKEKPVEEEDLEPMRWAELSYLDKTDTVLKITYSSNEADQVFKGNLKGNLTIYEANHRLFITDSVKRNQKDLNTTKTQIRINNDNAAFQQRLFINLQPPGSIVTDSDGKDVFEVGVYNKGPGQDLYLVSMEEEDESGNVKYARGDAKVLEPVDNQNLLRSAEEARNAIYRQCKQLHVIISGDATTSGESRLQAQGEYLLDLMDMKGVIDSAGRWLLETVYALAEVLAGKPPREDIKAVFDCRINPGPLTSEMRKAILEMMDKKAISRETAMSMLGVDDIEAERERLRQEAEEMGPMDRAKALEMTSKSGAAIIQNAAELFRPDMDEEGNFKWPNEAIEYLKQNGVQVNASTAPAS